MVDYFKPIVIKILKILRVPYAACCSNNNPVRYTSEGLLQSFVNNSWTTVNTSGGGGNTNIRYYTPVSVTDNSVSIGELVYDDERMYIKLPNGTIKFWDLLNL